MTKLIQSVAVKAIIADDNTRVLLLRKSEDNERHAGNAGQYNLPGGKIKRGESIEDALSREVLEETGIVVTGKAQKPLFVSEWRPVVKGVPYQILGIFFVCAEWQGKVTLDNEHDTYVWVNAQSLDAYKILPPEGQALATYFLQ